MKGWVNYNTKCSETSKNSLDISPKHFDLVLALAKLHRAQYFIFVQSSQAHILHFLCNVFLAAGVIKMGQAIPDLHRMLLHERSEITYEIRIIFMVVVQFFLMVHINNGDSLVALKVIMFYQVQIILTELKFLCLTVV